MFCEQVGIHGGRNDGGGRLRARSAAATRSRPDLGRRGLGDRADVDVRSRRVVDVVDGDVGEAILGERGELGVIDLAVLVFVELLPDAARLVLREAGS